MFTKLKTSLCEFLLSCTVYPQDDGTQENHINVKVVLHCKQAKYAFHFCSKEGLLNCVIKKGIAGLQAGATILALQVVGAL